MGRDRPVLGEHLSKYVFEFLLIFNVLFVARITEGIRDFRPFRYLFIGSWETRLEFEIESYLYHLSHPTGRFSPMDLPDHTAFLAVTLGMAALAVVVINVLFRPPFLRGILWPISGLASVLAIPACWLYIGEPYLQASGVFGRPALY